MEPAPDLVDGSMEQVVVYFACVAIALIIASVIYWILKGWDESRD